MQYVIPRDATEVAYQDKNFWAAFDEVVVEAPGGWYLRFLEGGIVHYFDYCQSSGHGEYVSEYRETLRKIPLAFSFDAKKNAELMHTIACSDKKAVLIREK